MIEPRLLDSIKPRTFFTVTAVVGILSGLASYLSFVLCFPLSLTAFVLLFMYEPKGRRIFSFVAPLLLLAAGLVLFYEHLPVLVCLPLSAALIVFCFKRRLPKFDVAMYTVLLLLVSELFVLWFIAGATVGAWQPSAAVAYYAERLSVMKVDMLSRVEQMLGEYIAENTLASEYLLYAKTTVDTFASLLPSLVVLMALLTVFIAFKLLCAILRRVDADGGAAAGRWHFTAPVVFAYFYIALFFLYLLSGEGLFATVVWNLYIPFAVIFAYIGYKYMRFMLSRSPRMRRYRTLIVILAIFFISLAVQLLAIEGVFAVITAHRMQKKRLDDER